MAASPPRPPRARSLTSIAATARVSVSTVSKVLNGRTDVAPQTRMRVGRILRLHGYQVAPPPGIGVVDLLVGGLGSPWSEELILGAVSSAAETEISVIVSRVGSAAEFDRWLNIAAGRGTRGALSVLYVPEPAALRRMADAHIPLVVIDPPVEPGDGSARSVGTTNWQGGVTAARHLVELGHRRIGAIGGPDDLWSCRARLDGYHAALRRAGLPADEALVRCDELSADGGLRQARELLQIKNSPTAIMAGNDAQAFGVLQALAERGLRAPDDVSVVGFDDGDEPGYYNPPLTTVRQDFRAVGRRGIEMLVEQIERGERNDERFVIEPELIIRKSTAKARKR